MFAVDHNDSFQATETGFSILDNGQRQEFSDTDVTAIRVQSNRIRTPGEGAQTREKLEIRVGDGGTSRVIGVSSDFDSSEANSLAPLRNRMLDALMARSLETFKRGDEVRGEDWTMSLAHFTDQRSGHAVPIQMISAAAWQDDDFCLWKEGDAEPFVRIPRSAENTYLLARLVGLFVEEAPSGHSTEQGEGWGQLLAEFCDMSPKMKYAEAAITAIGGVLMFVSLEFPFANVPFFAVPFATFVATAVAVGVIHFKYGKQHVLRHFENAVVLDNGTGEEVLSMGDLGTFSAQWTDHYYNHAYTGTTGRFRFYRKGSASPTMEHETHAKRFTDKFDRLEALQDHLSQVVAERMHRELSDTGRVRWTSQLSIVPDGLEFCKRDGAEPQHITFPQITDWSIKNGKMKLRVDGSWTAKIVQNVHEANFFPGLLLIQQLGAENEEDADLAETTHEDHARAN
jgi:hypothetical protein